ncbi:acyltransferase family protein [uncultured Vibrio sp.]|uniref:acyltransferase family protein n=1 Tax=uncultured Vibrio sp. TaxID=114054 RepID=UPI0025D9CC4D|nr:acyltransferase family protein [uncultured Vibrio sp.]
MNFRYDINGLRAIAVIAVVLFHFNPAWVPGGFAGVDVFFVISGFLMTSVIFKGLEEGDFRLIKFYVARIKRIIPVLVVVCIVLFFFALTLNEYKSFTLHKHIASSLSFLSNIVYWQESGYFDEVSKEKWLLHTWSLSVEWQFYILYPIVLVALKRFLSLENLKRFIVIGSVLGFIFSVIATIKWQAFSYYLLPTRAWEMMIGGVIFLYPFRLSNTNKFLVETIGLGLILTSYFLFSGDMDWPGYFAFVPVLGACLVILANRQSSFITNNKFFQNIGKWSYSIYLWHWPIIVFMYINDVKISFFIYALAVIILSFLSFSLIEKRSKNFSSGVVLVLSLCVIFASLFMYKNDREVNETKPTKLIKQPLSHEICRGISENCSYFGDGSVDFFLWGDSHSIFLSHYLANKGYNFIVFSTGGCPPIAEVRRHDGMGSSSNCNQKKNDIILEKIISSKLTNKVVMIGRWSLYRYGWLRNGELQKETHYLCSNDCDKVISDSNSFDTMKTHMKKTIYSLARKEVFLFLGNPILPRRGIDDFEQSLSFEDHRVFQNDTNELLKEIEHSFNNVHLIASDSYFFNNDNIMIYDSGRILYKDDNHPTIDAWGYVFDKGFKDDFDMIVLSN